MKNQQGYSLIELLTVITIIGTLANIGVAAFSDAQQDANDANWKNDLRVVAQALELYYSDYGHYQLPRGGASASCGGTGTGIGFINAAGCSPNPSGQNYDTSITIVGELQLLGYLSEGYKLTNEGPGLDPLLYICDGDTGPDDITNGQAYALYAYLYSDDQNSIDLVDQGRLCGANRQAPHGTNYVVYSNLVEGLSCWPGFCGNGTKN